MNKTAPCNGLAVDWMHRHLYIAYGGLKPSISMITLAGTGNTTLLSKGLEKPTAIVVDPRNG